MNGNMMCPTTDDPVLPPASPLRYAALRHLGFFMAALMFLWSAAPAFAQIMINTGGGFTPTGPDELTITFNNPTTSPIIDYSSFNIAGGQNIIIDDANVLNGRSLHRISGGTSTIAGGLKADNTIYLINPSGIVFADGANVNVGGLVASTLTISTNDFLDGNLNFSYSSSTGRISVANGAQIASKGIAYFLGQSVDIQGSVRAGDIFVGAYGRLAAEPGLVLETAGGASITLDLTGLAAGGGNVDISNASIEGTNSSGTLTAMAGGTLTQTNGVVTNMAAIHMQAVNAMRVHTLYADATNTASISLATLEGSLQLERDGILHASSNITMVSTNNSVLMMNNSSLSAGGDLTLTSGSNMTLRSVTSTTGNVRATSGGAMVLNNTMTAVQGNIILGMTNASRLLEVHGAVSATNGYVDAQSSGGFLLTNGASMSGGAVWLAAQAGEGRMSADSTLTATNNLNVYSVEELELSGTVASGGALSASSLSNNLIAGRNLTADGYISLYSGGDMALKEVVSTNGTIRMNAGMNLAAQGAITANNGTVRVEAREGDMTLLNVSGQEVTLLAEQGGISAGNLSASGTLALEAGKDIQTGALLGTDVGVRSTGGNIRGASAFASSNLALEAAGNIVVDALTARQDLFAQAGGNISGNGKAAVIRAVGNHFVNAGGTEHIDSSGGMRVYAMDMTLYRLGEEMFDPMVFSGNMPVPVPVPDPQPNPPPPPPDPAPVPPSVLEQNVQRAIVEIAVVPASLREGVPDEDNLFFLDGTVPYPGPANGRTIQYLKYSFGVKSLIITAALTAQEWAAEQVKAWRLIHEPVEGQQQAEVVDESRQPAEVGGLTYTSGAVHPSLSWDPKEMEIKLEKKTKSREPVTIQPESASVELGL